MARLSAFWAVAVLATGVADAIKPLMQGSQPYNLKGDLLILDAGSLGYLGPRPRGPGISTPEACRDYCMKVTGCSGWTFCSAKGGCGSGCDTYVAKNKQLDPGGNPEKPNPEWYKMKAILSFGVWGDSSQCQGSKWPFGMCSLKALKNPAKPEYHSQNKGEGWVSGWIILPAECKGTTGRACQRCLQSAAPDKCVACAKNSKLQMRMVDQSVASTSTLQSQDLCATCYNTGSPDKCTDCLYNNKPCRECVSVSELLSPGQKIDTSKCIDCSNKYGASFSGICSSCALLAAQPTIMEKCFVCAGRVTKVACKGDGCWDPEMASTNCAGCSQATDPESCIQCIERKPYSNSCATCAGQPDKTTQKKCYDCVKAAGTSTVCGDCIISLSDPKQLDQCFACVTNPKTLPEARGECFGCQNWCNTPDGRAKCSTCLQKKVDSYSSVCGNLPGC